MATGRNGQKHNGEHVGKIVQVIGSTFDVEFPEGHLPEIYNAARVDAEHKGVKINLTGEVQQHLGGNRVRCVALGSTDGLVRNMDVIDTGKPVQVRNHDAAGVDTESGPYLRSDLPIAGFALIEAASLDDAIVLASQSPCAVAHGVVEVWPLET